MAAAVGDRGPIGRVSYVRREPKTHGVGPVQEECGICGEAVPYSVTAHVLIHPNTDEGVMDYYVCRSCYDERIAPLFD